MSDTPSAPDQPRTAAAGALPRMLLRLADPAPRQIQSFDLRPEAPARAALAESLEISGIRKLAFSGRLIPEGRHDWRLEGDLGATVVQPCVATGAPVATRIDEKISRRYLVDIDDAAQGEVEMPDDEIEPRPAVLDLGEVMAEALSLALPAWPRAEGAAALDLTVSAPGVVPLTQETARPFAGLAGLRARLEKDGEDN